MNDQINIGSEELESIEGEALIREKFNVLTRLLPILYSFIIFNGFLLALNFRARAPFWLGVALPLTFVALIIVRLRVWIGLRGTAAIYDLAKIKRLLRGAAVIGPALSLGFTIVGFLLMQEANEIERSLAIVLIWVSAAACSFCLFAVPSAAILVMIASTVPLCLAFLTSGSDIMIVATPSLVTVSALMIFILRENYRTFATIVTSRSQLEEAHRQAQQAKEDAVLMANTDPLTGLANRRHFDVRLAAQVKSAELTGTPFLVAMIDLDGFKLINDIHGHVAGDRFLIEASSRIRGAVGGEGIVARMGGDEFAVLIEGVSEAAAAVAWGKRLVAAIDAPFLCGTIIARLRASCGVAVYDGLGKKPGRLVEHADIALYAAKAQAPGSVVLFTEQLENEALERAMIEQGLRVAVVEDAFSVYYQPIIVVQSGAIAGFEALARWCHPQLGPISPAVFIPIAEQIGLIDSLTDYLLREAAATASGWSDGLTLSFNLSARQIARPGADIDILNTLEACRLPPARFEIEVTETAIMSDLEGSIRTMANLKNAGVRISLDDFGTGYSSFSQLRDLPLDKLKIDKSFIDKLGEDDRATNVVSAIIGVCAHLKLDCIAEGIEREDQMALLRELGCSLGQGFYVAGALPHQSIPDLIAAVPSAAL